MPAARLHLVRHGEVHNPDRVLYERIPGFGLSEAGRAMTRQAAAYVHETGRPVTSLIASPLQRTQESAEPFTEIFGLEPELDERVIEPWNVFAGKQMRRALVNPVNWRHLRTPARPSWGEPYEDVVARVREAMDHAWDSTASGDSVIVSHQLPIWVTHLSVAGLPLRHDPRRRRCELSSVTSFERRDGVWHEVGYASPASTGGAIDVGAV